MSVLDATALCSCCNCCNWDSRYSNWAVRCLKARSHPPERDELNISTHGYFRRRFLVCTFVEVIPLSPTLYAQHSRPHPTLDTSAVALVQWRVAHPVSIQNKMSYCTKSYAWNFTKGMYCGRYHRLLSAHYFIPRYKYSTVHKLVSPERHCLVQVQVLSVYPRT